MGKKGWEPVDWIILILALILFLAVLLPISRTLIIQATLQEKGLSMITQIILAAILIIGVYVQGKIKRKKDEEEDDDSKK